MRPASDRSDASISVRALCFCVSLCVCTTAAIAFGQTNDAWLGGNGNWSNGSMWSNGIPNGNVNVFIDDGNAAGSAVTLDVSPSIANLTIDSDDSLNVLMPQALTLYGNSIGNAGQLLVSGYFSLGAPVTLSGSGVLTLQGGQIGGLNGVHETLTNQSTIVGSGGIYDLANQGVINANVGNNMLWVGALDNSATMKATAYGELMISGPTSNNATIEADDYATVLIAGPATNTGIMKSTGSGTMTIAARVTNTGGTIQSQGYPASVRLTNGEIDGGTVSGWISGSGTLTNLSVNGNLSVWPGQTTVMSGTISDTGTIDVEGELECVNATTLSGSGNLTIEPKNLRHLHGKGMLSVNGTSVQLGLPLSNYGTLSVDKGGLLNITGSFTNFASNTLLRGSYEVAGTLQFKDANIVISVANITLTGPASQIIDQNGSNALANFTKNSPKQLFALAKGKTLAVSTDFINQGTLKLDTRTNFQAVSYTQTAGTTKVKGTLTAPSGVSIQGGTVFGGGTIAGAVVSSGSVTAGGSATAAGKLSMSAYTQNASGTLNIQIGGTAVGTQYSQLAAANGVSLKGALNIKLIKGFVPALGNTFTVLTGSAITGQFTTVNGLSINGSEHFQITYNPTNVILTVVSGAQ